MPYWREANSISRSALKDSKSMAQGSPPYQIDGLLKANKLILLVDLDKTLIDTISGNLSPVEGIYNYHLDETYGKNYHTRVRPGTEIFLSEISKYFELHICTRGSKRYAQEITNIVDPDRVYFDNRIIAREDQDSSSKTQILKSHFPEGDSIVCIIDDRKDMWDSINSLIQVKPYHFFPPCDQDIGSTRSRYKLDKIDFSQRICDDMDDYLLYLVDILKSVHETFFNTIKFSNSSQKVHISTVIPHVRRQVLRGVTIVFSGVFPLNMPLESNKIWRLAMALGAKVDPKVTQETTHLVASSYGTDKVLQAKSFGTIQIVTLDWFYCCEERWERVDERLFNFEEDQYN